MCYKYEKYKLKNTTANKYFRLFKETFLTTKYILHKIPLISPSIFYYLNKLYTIKSSKITFHRSKYSEQYSEQIK